MNIQISRKKFSSVSIENIHLIYNKIQNIIHYEINLLLCSPNRMLPNPVKIFKTNLRWIRQVSL